MLFFFLFEQQNLNTNITSMKVFEPKRRKTSIVVVVWFDLVCAYAIRSVSSETDSDNSV